MSHADLLVQAGTRLAVHQWLQARGLGVVAQDTDPTSPTFGEWLYRHTDPESGFIWWRHPSGKLESTYSVDDSDPENPVYTITYYTGFFGMLRFKTQEILEDRIGDWVRDNTAISILEGFNGVGGEGITIITPGDVATHLASIGAPGHEWLGPGIWSDPTLWWASPVMTGDLREFDGAIYRSLIDFNVWTLAAYPEGWEYVEDVEPDPDPSPSPWVQPTGAHDAYALGAIVTHNGQTWESTVDGNVWEPGVFGWTVV